VTNLAPVIITVEGGVIQSVDFANGKEAPYFLIDHDLCDAGDCDSLKEYIERLETVTKLPGFSSDNILSGIFGGG
jgi:hypothetical protein